MIKRKGSETLAFPVRSIPTPSSTTSLELPSTPKEYVFSPKMDETRTQWTPPPPPIGKVSPEPRPFLPPPGSSSLSLPFMLGKYLNTNNPTTRPASPEEPEGHEEPEEPSDGETEEVVRENIPPGPDLPPIDEPEVFVEEPHYRPSPRRPHWVEDEQDHSRNIPDYHYSGQEVYLEDHEEQRIFHRPIEQGNRHDREARNHRRSRPQQQNSGPLSKLTGVATPVGFGLLVVGGSLGVLIAKKKFEEHKAHQHRGGKGRGSGRGGYDREDDERKRRVASFAREQTLLAQRR